MPQDLSSTNNITFWYQYLNDPFMKFVLKITTTTSFGTFIFFNSLCIQLIDNCLCEFEKALKHILLMFWSCFILY